MTSLNPSRRIASSAIQFFNNVETVADQIIGALPSMPETEILDVRGKSRLLGHMAWRVEVACDAEIVNRQSQRRGRGIKDEEEKGVKAAALKHAQAIGVHPVTVFENAKIQKEFFNGSGATTIKDCLDTLNEREYYRIAVHTEQPVETLKKFAARKRQDPTFSTRDAQRMTKESKTPPLDETVPALCDQPDVIAAWNDFQLACRNLISTAPRLQSLINGYMEEIQYELTVPPQSVEQTIFDLIRQGYNEADQIAARMKRDRIHVIVWLNRLCDMGRAESFEKERAPGARGQARTGYREL